MTAHMIVYLDNIIFSLRPGSNESRHWATMTRSLMPMPDAELRFIEYADAMGDEYRYRLDVARRGHLYVMRNLWLTRHLAVRIDGYAHTPFIFHSSWYRICDNPWATNVITVDGNFSPTPRRLWALRHCDLVICTSRNALNSLPATLQSKATVISTKKSNTNIALLTLKAYRRALPPYKASIHCASK